MSINDAVAALNSAMSGFATTFKSNLNKKVQEAANADNATELNNLTPAQVVSAMEADLDAHAATAGQSHALTLSEAGMYSATTIDGKFSPTVPTANLPICRYGELSYFLVNVSGSFEGATTNFGKQFSTRYYPCTMEADGSLVYLRNGTNGNTRGVYYAYLKNALNGTLGTATRTNTKYQPGYFPSGYTAQYVWKSDDQVIWGQLQDSTGAVGQMFLSLTAGTYDQTGHVGCFFDLAGISVASDGSSYPEAFLGGDNVFIVVPGLSATGQPVEFNIFYIPVASVRAGGTVTPTLITSWQTTSFYGVESRSTLRIAGCQASTNAADKPLVLVDSTKLPNVGLFPFHSAANTFDLHSAYDPATGNCRTRVTGLFWAQNGTNGETEQWWQVFSFTWNINTQTAQLDAGLANGGNPAVTLTTNSDGNMVFSGTFVMDKALVGPNDFQTGDNMYYHSAGYWLAVNDSSQPDYPNYLSRAALVTTGLSKYQALLYNVPTSQSNRSAVGFYSSYGSAIGGDLMGSYQLPNGWLLVSCDGLFKNGSVGRSLALAKRGSLGWVYGSLTGGKYSGYAPTTQRSMVDDLGFNPVSFNGIISEISAAGVVIASGYTYLENILTSGFTSINEALATSGSVSISPAAASALKAQILAQAGQTVTDSRIGIYVPQNTAIPPIAYVSLLQANAPNFECVVMAELAITGGSRTSNITGFSIVSLSAVTQLVQFPSGYIDDGNWAAITGGLTIFETSDAYLVGGAGKHQTARPGWSGSFTHRFAIPKSTNRPDWTTFSSTAYWMAFDTPYPTAIPGQAFGINYQTYDGSGITPDCDYYTKLLFQPYATDLASFKSWTKSPTEQWLVQVSQDVAQGWVVYFTDITPVIMNGVAYTLPPATIDLTTIQANPANTTFYVYVVITNGNVSYLLTTTKQAESLTTMYVGTIVTGDAAISSLNVQKVTRLGTYRIATASQGMAVPTSGGTPDSASHLNWK